VDDADRYMAEVRRDVGARAQAFFEQLCAAPVQPVTCDLAELERALRPDGLLRKLSRWLRSVLTRGVR